MRQTHDAGEQLELNLGGGWRAPNVREVLYFAIMPDADAATAIGAVGRRLARRYGLDGRWRPPGRLHVSLLGWALDPHMRQQSIAIAKQIGARVAQAPFDVELTRALRFGKAPLGPLVLCCSTASAMSLGVLQAAVVNAAIERKPGLRGRSKFAPHLTLAYQERKIPDTPLADPITWPARELVLVHSEQGLGRYSRLARWSLD